MFSRPCNLNEVKEISELTIHRLQEKSGHDHLPVNKEIKSLSLKKTHLSVVLAISHLRVFGI